MTKKTKEKVINKTDTYIIPTSGHIVVDGGFSGLEGSRCDFELLDNNYVLTAIEDSLEVDELAEVSKKLQDLQQTYNELYGLN